MPTSKQRRHYSLEFLPSAFEEWQALDGSIRKQFKQVLARRLEQPRVPGSELHGRLRDCYKVKLRKSGYRLVYKIESNLVVVTVIAVGKRENDAVYVAAQSRIPRG